MFNVYFFGSLAVTVDVASGAILAVTDRVSGLAASLRYSPAYIAQARSYAHQAWASTADATL